MSATRVPLKHIADWGSGEAFWVYDHVLAARPGALLMVPVHLVEGGLNDLCALCPVPYEGALAVMDQERRLVFEDLVDVDMLSPARWTLVQAMAGDGCWFGAYLPEMKSMVFRHEHGLRLAVAEELVLSQSLRGRYGESATA